MEFVKTQRKPIANSAESLKEQKKKFNPSFSNPYKILIVGDGLETSAKKLVYDMMWGSNTCFKMTNLYPGADGIGSGVGFEVNGSRLNVSAIYDYTVLFSEKEDYIEKWITLFNEANALIFVMDLEGDPYEVKIELDRLSQYGLVLRPNVPLAIFACKHELDPMVTYPTPTTISEQLELSFLNRPWCVRTVEVKTLDGVFEGLDWILSWMS